MSFAQCRLFAAAALADARLAPGAREVAEEQLAIALWAVVESVLDGIAREDRTP